MVCGHRIADVTKDNLTPQNVNEEERIKIRKVECYELPIALQISYGCYPLIRDGNVKNQIKTGISFNIDELEHNCTGTMIATTTILMTIGVTIFTIYSIYCL